MDRLQTFGLFAVTAMVVCYALEDRSRWYVLGFAGACGLGSVYGFLQGAWPFGVVEAIWAVIALPRWLTVCGPKSAGTVGSQDTAGSEKVTAK
jgi:hypothetical protein